MAVVRAARCTDRRQKHVDADRVGDGGSVEEKENEGGEFRRADDFT